MRTKKKGTGLSIAALCITTLICMADLAIIPGAEGIVVHFIQDTPMGAINFILSGSQITAMIGALLSPLFIRKFDNKSILLVCIAVFCITGVVSGFIDNAYGISVCRALMGFPMGIVLPVCMTMIFVWFVGDGVKTARYVGFLNGTMAISGVFLTIVGGLLASMTWNAPFFLYLVGVPIFILDLVAIPSQKGNDAEAAEGAPIEEEAAEDERRYACPKAKLAVLFIMMVLISILYGVMGYQYSIYIAERALGDVVFGAAVASLMAVASGVAGFIFGPIFNKVKAWGLPISFALMALAFVGFHFASSLVIASVLFAIVGFAYGVAMSWFFAYAELSVPHRMAALSSSVITIANYLGLFLTTYFVTMMQEILGVGGIAALCMPVAVMCFVLLVVSIALIVVEKRIDMKGC